MTKLMSGAHLAVRGVAGLGCWRGRREEEIRDSEDISHELADSAPPCQAVVSCHINQNDKNIEIVAIVVLNM